MIPLPNLGRRQHTGPGGHLGSEKPGAVRPSSPTGRPVALWPFSPCPSSHLARGIQGPPCSGHGPGPHTQPLAWFCDTALSVWGQRPEGHRARHGSVSLPAPAPLMPSSWPPLPRLSQGARGPGAECGALSDRGRLPEAELSSPTCLSSPVTAALGMCQSHEIKIQCLYQGLSVSRATGVHSALTQSPKALASGAPAGRPAPLPAPRRSAPA